MMEAPAVYTSSSPSQGEPFLVRLLAKIISWLFHPLFLLTYIIIFLLFIHPYAFAGNSAGQKLAILAMVVLNTLFIPGIVVVLMRLLRLVRSMELLSQRDRIIPLASTMIWYFWAWYVTIHRVDLPPVFRQQMMAGFLAVCFTWFLNIFYKVSMHAVGMGGLVLFMLILSLTDESASALYLSVALLIAGMVISSRLILGRHVMQEVYSGFMAGAFCQVIAWLWYFVF